MHIQEVTVTLLPTTDLSSQDLNYPALSIQNTSSRKHHLKLKKTKNEKVFSTSGSITSGRFEFIGMIVVLFVNLFQKLRKYSRLYSIM